MAAEEYRREVAQRILITRLALGWRQASDAAEAWGFNKFAYYSWENGRRNVTPHELPKLAKAMGVTLDWLLAGRKGNLKQKLVKAIKKQKKALGAAQKLDHVA